MLISQIYFSEREILLQRFDFVRKSWHREQFRTNRCGPPTTMPPIFPKLWRRLDKYSRDSDVTDHDSLSEFKDYLESLPEDLIVVSV